jgi:NitT/TauT family transport system ATP-binding protein
LTSENQPKLVINDVSKKFISSSRSTLALEKVSFSVMEGEFVCLLGPSGCGKSTLLNLIAGLDFPDSGHILADGNPITHPDNERIMMFQESALFPWLNVFDNVLFGLKLKKGLSRKERKKIADFYLQLVRLQNFKYSYIHELSGGMKQRVSLARALAPNPEVLLMDEPFAALDAMTREQIYVDLQEIWQKYKKTIVFVTHNVAEAVCLGDRVVLFSPSPGKNHEEFTIDLPRPRDIRSLEVAQYVSEIIHLLRSYVPTGGI